MTDQAYALLTDAGIRRFLIESDSFYPPDALEQSIDQQRVLYNTMCTHFRRPRPDKLSVTNLTIASAGIDIPVRIYAPVANKPLPVMLYLHGGGFVVGNLDSHDDICAEIAHRTSTLVVAVAYRLAPEQPFPAAFDDCKAVLDALPGLAAEFAMDIRRVLVGGDSAGGNLAASLCLDARDRATPLITGQVLIYPGLGGDSSKGSYLSQAEAPGLSTRDLEFYRDIYLGPPESPHHHNKLANPLLETDYLGLPPAFLVAAHYDPLCDDCAAYAQQLQQAGVAVQLREEPLLVHAFLRARHMSVPAGKSFDAIVAAIESLAHNGRLP